MEYMKAKSILHRGKGKAENHEQVIIDCAKNLRLTKNAIKLLKYYAICNNGFSPALETIDKTINIGKKNISSYRRELVNHGIIGYGEEFGDRIVVDWNRIRIFAMLGHPLDYDKKNPERFFSFVHSSKDAARGKRNGKKTLLERGKRFKIPGVDEKKDVFLQFYGNMTEQEYVDLVRAFPEYGRNKQRCLMSDAEYAKHIDIKAFRPNAYQEHTYTKEEQEQYEKNLAFMKAALHILPF